MKNIAICYSEHAIKVSDSYCSGPSNHVDIPSHSSSPTQTSISSIYRIKLSTEKLFLINFTWLNQAFSVTISDHPFCTTKLSRSFKTLRRSGSESFGTGGLKAGVFWDLRRARYNSGPEPFSGFYVAVLINSELGLMLGDLGHEFEAKNDMSGLRMSEFSLISRRERFSGDGVYSTKAKFSEVGTSHDIVIKFTGADRMAPFLSVSVDKKSVIEVKRLQWNFRGNQSIFLDGLLIDLMWDVHDWVFNPSSGHGVFLFRTRRGLDSRLWFEGRDKNFDQEKVAFSFLIFASKNPD